MGRCPLSGKPAPISFRIEKRQLVIKLYYGNEIRTNLLRREPAHSP